MDDGTPAARAAAVFSPDPFAERSTDRLVGENEN